MIPPDYERCQATFVSYRPFVMGGAVKQRVQCTSPPVWLAVEVEPGADGLRGAMTLCHPCAEKMLEVEDLRRRVQLQPIAAKEKK